MCDLADMLMSAGVPLPRQVFGHGFVYLKGEQMSKSLGTVVEPLEAARAVRRRIRCGCIW